MGERKANLLTIAAVALLYTSLCTPTVTVTHAQTENPPNATTVFKGIEPMINGAVDFTLAIGTVMSAAGIVILFMIGILKIDVMSQWGRTEGMRDLIRASEAMVTLPIFIMIVWGLASAAQTPAQPFGNPSTPGSPAWWLVKVWEYIMARYSDIAGIIFGGAG